MAIPVAVALSWTGNQRALMVVIALIINGWAMDSIMVATSTIV